MSRNTPINEGRELLARMNEARENMTVQERHKLFDEVCGYSEDKPFGSCERSYSAEEFGEILEKVCSGMFETPLTFDNKDSIQEYFNGLEELGVTVTWKDELTPNEVIGLLKSAYDKMLSKYEDFPRN